MNSPPESTPCLFRVLHHCLDCGLLTGPIPTNHQEAVSETLNGEVGRPEIDKLRGAIQGDYDHGVFITTSRFTREAAEASYKKGAISVLLLDGDSVVEMMLERGIGVVKQPLYLYEISDDFFDFEKQEK